MKKEAETSEQYLASVYSTFMAKNGQAV